MSAWERLKDALWGERKPGFDQWLDGSVYRNDSVTFHMDLWNAFKDSRDLLMPLAKEVEAEIAALRKKLAEAEKAATENRDLFIWAADRLDMVLERKSVRDADEVVLRGQAAKERRDAEARSAS